MLETETFELNELLDREDFATLFKARSLHRDLSEEWGQTASGRVIGAGPSNEEGLLT
jgi:hypothetical protein